MNETPREETRPEMIGGVRDTLKYWVTEREEIRKRRLAGMPRPWTEDAILDKYRFCCVRREDDRVTRWVNDNVRVPYADHPNLWLMLCICRQINWPDTLAELIDRDAWPSVVDGFSPAFMGVVLNERKRRGDKVYTGAYVVSAPAAPRSSKQTYIAERVIGSLWKRSQRPDDWRQAGTMQSVHAWLMDSPGWGNFMAYQAVVDMRFCPNLLGDATDRATWAAAGPGTIRGLNRLHGRRVTAEVSQYTALDEIREIYRWLPEETGVDMDLSDVPNVMCETDKYLRAKNGEGKPRTLYVPGRGA